MQELSMILRTIVPGPIRSGIGIGVVGETGLIRPPVGIRRAEFTDPARGWPHVVGRASSVGRPLCQGRVGRWTPALGSGLRMRWLAVARPGWARLGQVGPGWARVGPGLSQVVR